MSTIRLAALPSPEAPPVVLTVGRVNFDLFVSDSGVSIQDATDYMASVGGSPANIAIVARKLGIPSAVLSATGEDETGWFVRAELQRYGVSTSWLGESAAGATSLALLATLGPDRGERLFYRHDPADTYVEPAVVEDLPWASLRAVVLSADALATGPMAQTVAAVARAAADHDRQVWWDLDLRPNSWTDSHRYRDTVPAAVDRGATVIGTEEEFAAFFGVGEYDLDVFRAGIRDHALPVVVLKRGPKGATLFIGGESVVNVPARTVHPHCTVGAGDTTAGALIAARLAGQTWMQAMEFSMHAAAWTVSQPYCSTGFPAPSDLGIEPLTPVAEAALG